MGPTPTELAFIALEDTLSKTAVRHTHKVKPFSIGVLDRAQTWSFDPGRQALFSRAPIATPALHLFLSESALCQMAFGVGDALSHENLQYVGDLEVLKTFASSLIEAKNAISIRVKDVS